MYTLPHFYTPTLSLLPPLLYNLCSLLVRGCDFQYDANQVSLGSSLKKAIITGNIITVSLIYKVHMYVVVRLSFMDSLVWYICMYLSHHQYIKINEDAPLAIEHYKFYCSRGLLVCLVKLATHRLV